MGFLRVIIVLGVVIGGFALWFHSALQPVNVTDAARQIVEIPKGFSTEQIAQLLEEKGIIKSSLAFRLYAKWQGMENKLQAGSFVLTPSLNADALVSALSNAVAKESAITIPEGFTVDQIDALLAGRGLIKPGEFSECARTCDLSAFSFLPKRAGLAARGGNVEGYLFPDTYFVLTDGFTAESFMKRLLQTFQSRVVTGLADDIAASGKPLHDLITMASLIEEEAASDEERPTISGILWKRDDAPMSLGVDAAVRYILSKPSADITASDLKIDSPYNLRKYPGLPPGPIANPGIASIRAAMHPKDSPYWYYLHGSDGVIRYAETNDGHNENKRKYL